MPRGEPYSGATRKLLLAIDIGTTFSGVSFCILDPGKIPEVLSVIRYPGQEAENQARDTKIPSVLYYDEDGEVRAAGAEAVSDGIRMEAEDEGWACAEWFKLRLRPEGTQARGERLPEILIDKSVVQIFADYLAYIYRCAKAYISDTNAVGRQIIDSGMGIEFVLSHPNGWSGHQQSKMRRAAILANMVEDTAAGKAKIHFVSEGEASLHFCIITGLAGESIKRNKHIMVVDAGGGTIDLSTYKVVQASPLNVIESAAADCLLQGSIYVNLRARIFLEYKLRGSRFDNEEFIDAMIDSFEQSAKPTFRDVTKTSYIKFGGPRDMDEQHDIKRGVLTLSGSEMFDFFRPSIDAIQSAIQKQLDASGSDCENTTILLVGGFAGNPFLRSHLHEFSRKIGVALFFPEHQTAKAVAEGALWHHLDHFVTARRAKYVYGTDCNTRYIPSKPDHFARRHKTFTHLDGELKVPDAFSRIIAKGTLVTEEEEFRSSFSRKSTKRASRVSARIMSYHGMKQDPCWMDEESDKFSTLCHVHAAIPQSMWSERSGLVGKYYRLSFDVVLLLGLTEIKAQIAWTEGGKEHRAPAVVVYDADDADEDD